MKIAFADFIDWEYTPQTPYEKPLGGTQSAACYLSVALAEFGHSITYFSNTTAASLFRGVQCLPLKMLTADQLRQSDFDVLIVVLNTGQELALKAVLPRRTRLILWTGHADDEQGVQSLKITAYRDAYDAVVLASDWQRGRYISQFDLDPSRAVVLRYAMSPHFESLFAEGESIVSAKSSPPTLAYTSTPYRGLILLPDIFPRIRARIPQARLQVFSSLGVYHVPPQQDQARFGSLYQHLRSMPGVEYYGSLSQPQLAAHLRKASMLAYPNNFRETGCIAVMEAMAAGCRIVTTDLAALPETTAGFATLVSAASTNYVAEFVERAVHVLENLSADESHLHAQVNYIKKNCTWSIRAREWVNWLAQWA